MISITAGTLNRSSRALQNARTRCLKASGSSDLTGVIRAPTTCPVTGIRLGKHGRIPDVVELQQDILDFGRVHFLAAHVDQLRLASDDTNVFALDLNDILRVEPAFIIEGRGRIQVAQHRRFRSEPQHAVDDAVLEAGIAELEPQRVRAARLRRHDAELGELHRSA